MALAENAITQEMAEWGIEAARRDGSKWLPAPGMFVQWCRHPEPQRLGLPSFDAAWRQAQNKNWKHPEVYHAAKRVPVALMWGTNVAPANHELARPRFDDSYANILRRRALGEVFSTDAAKQGRAISHSKGKKPIDWQKGRAALAQIKAQLAGGCHG